MRSPRITLFTSCWLLSAVAAALVPISVARAGKPAPAVSDAVAEPEEEADGTEPIADADRPTTAPAHADCDHRVPLWVHTVSGGEHLGGIAGRYGVRQHDLLALNPTITEPNLIRIGQPIRVCPEIFPRLEVRKAHRVQAGETLTKIAARYGLTIAEVVGMQGGGVLDRNHLLPGQTLTVVVDGGLVPDFAPPPPPPKRARKRGGTRRPKAHRKGVAVTMQMRGDERVYIKRPHLAYGTPKTIGLLGKVVAQYRSRFGRAPKVLIGDISKRGGGKIDPHLSHRRGADIDVGYVLTGADGKRTRFSGVTPDNLDKARTWALLKAFLDTQQVRYIFMDYRLQKVLYEYAAAHGASKQELDEVFQYPRGRGKNHGLIRHWKSHRNHFHVRFRS